MIRFAKKKKQFFRPTWAEVDLSAIEYNFRQVQRLTRSKTKILVALKADAYGHGAIKVAERLARCGADYFGVATVQEAIELREHHIRTPVLLLTSASADDVDVFLKYTITPTVADRRTAIALNTLLQQRRKKMPVHLKIDTGMGRIGVWHKEAFDFVQCLWRLPHIVVEGIYTHLPSADEDERFTCAQLNVFRDFISALEERGIAISLKHVANSAALMRYPQSFFNLVRPGIMIYGLYADAHARRFIRLKPALSFKTRITYLKEVGAGRPISYGRTFTTKKHARIATLPVGYADGYNRLLSNRAAVLIEGKRCPVVGRVCMDHTMVDVTNTSAHVGSEVVLIGRQKGASIGAEEIATLCSTISYEVVCWISKRVPRLYC